VFSFYQLSMAGGRDGAAVERVLGYTPPTHSSPRSTIYHHPPRQAVQPVASIQTTLTLLFILHHPGITPPHTPPSPIRPQVSTTWGRVFGRLNFTRRKLIIILWDTWDCTMGKRRWFLPAQLKGRVGVEGIV
jgi:hypothetical protein